MQTTRKYPRTLNEAYPFGPQYACAIERPSKREKCADYMLAITIGIALAACLFFGLS